MGHDLQSAVEELCDQLSGAPNTTAKMKRVIQRSSRLSAAVRLGAVLLFAAGSIGVGYAALRAEQTQRLHRARVLIVEPPIEIVGRVASASPR